VLQAHLLRRRARAFASGCLLLGPVPTVESIGDPSTLSASLSSAVPSPAVGLLADGVDSSSLVVTIREGNGNPLSGQTVFLSASGPGNTIGQASTPTDAMGVATGTLASTAAEVKAVAVTVNPGPSWVLLDDQPVRGQGSIRRAGRKPTPLPR
jgi:hypothetical protein